MESSRVPTGHARKTLAIPMLAWMLVLLVALPSASAEPAIYTYSTPHETPQEPEQIAYPENSTVYILVVYTPNESLHAEVQTPTETLGVNLSTTNTLNNTIYAGWFSLREHPVPHGMTINITVNTTPPLHKTIYTDYQTPQPVIVSPGSLALLGEYPEWGNQSGILVLWNLPGEHTGTKCNISLSPVSTPPGECQSLDYSMYGAEEGNTLFLPLSDLKRACDGLHELTISCTDMAGNEGTTSINTTIKTRPPLVQFAVPSSWVRAWNATIRVLVLDQALASPEYDCNITMNNHTTSIVLGAPGDYSCLDKGYSHEINLSGLFPQSAFAPNTTITLECSDGYYEAGNTTSLRVLMPATISLHAPRDGETLEPPLVLSILVNGSTETIDHYEIQAWNNLDPSLVITVNTTNTTIDLSPEFGHSVTVTGEYGWRARGVYPDGSTTPWTPNTSFILYDEPVLTGTIECEDGACTMGNSVVGSEQVLYEDTNGITAGGEVGLVHYLFLSTPGGARELYSPANSTPPLRLSVLSNHTIPLPTGARPFKGTRVCARAETTGDASLTVGYVHADSGHGEPVVLAPPSSGDGWYCAMPDTVSTTNISRIEFYCDGHYGECTIHGAWLLQPSRALLYVYGIRVEPGLEDTTFEYNGTLVVARRHDDTVCLDTRNQSIRIGTRKTTLWYTHETYKGVPVLVSYPGWSLHRQDENRDSIAGGTVWVVLPVTVTNKARQEFSRVRIPPPDCPGSWECTETIIDSLDPLETREVLVRAKSNDIITLENTSIPTLPQDSIIIADKEYKVNVQYKIKNRDSIPYDNVLVQPVLDGWSTEPARIDLDPWETRMITLEMHKTLVNTSLGTQEKKTSDYTMEVHKTTLVVDKYARNHPIQYGIPVTLLKAWNQRTMLSISLDGSNLSNSSWRANNSGVFFSLPPLSPGTHELVVTYYTRYVEHSPSGEHIDVDSPSTPTGALESNTESSHQPQSMDSGSRESEEDTTDTILVSPGGMELLRVTIRNTLSVPVYNATPRVAIAPLGWNLSITNTTIPVIPPGGSVSLGVVVRTLQGARDGLVGIELSGTTGNRTVTLSRTIPARIRDEKTPPREPVGMMSVTSPAWGTQGLGLIVIVLSGMGVCLAGMPLLGRRSRTRRTRDQARRRMLEKVRRSVT